MLKKYIFVVSLLFWQINFVYAEYLDIEEFRANSFTDQEFLIDIENAIIVRDMHWLTINSRCNVEQPEWGGVAYTCEQFAAVVFSRILSEKIENIGFEISNEKSSSFDKYNMLVTTNKSTSFIVIAEHEGELFIKLG